MNEPAAGSGQASSVSAMVTSLAGLGARRADRGVADGELDQAAARELLAQLGELERLKSAASAAQARVTVEFERVSGAIEARRRERAAELAAASGADDFTVWRARKGRIEAPPGVGAQVALARRLSPHQGAKAVALAQTLATSMPHTLAALTEGVLSERRAEAIVRESSHLAPEHRALVDAEVAGDPQAGTWGDREVERRTRAVAYRIDPQGAVERARVAVTERRVTIRPVPDAMCRVTALLPLVQGVATYAALRRDADSARATGDERGHGPLMADRLVELVTGQAVADEVPVEVQVVISDQALLQTGTGPEDPAQLTGYGSVPAGWVRDLLTRDTQDDNDASSAKVWLRRLYATPDSSELVAMESTRRLFSGGIRRFLIARDGTCRTPWCDAPVRHLDHVTDHVRGGPTSVTNGQGLCVRCNHTKQLEGWQVETIDTRDGPHRVRWRTPTGLTYTSLAPPLLPGATPRRERLELTTPDSVIELALSTHQRAA